MDHYNPSHLCYTVDVEGDGELQEHVLDFTFSIKFLIKLMIPSDVVNH